MPDQSLRQLRELLEAEKEEFLAVASHELRTPMTGVKGYLSMILGGDAGDVPPKIKEYTAQAYVSNEKLIKLVDQMLKVARLQEGRTHLNIERVDLDEQIKLLISDFAIPAQEKSIKIDYRPIGEKVKILADADKTREILMNLISNAIKFNNPGGSIIISSDIKDEWIIIKVKDTGIGVKREDQQRIFGIFSKANLSLTGQEKGTGLGLYVACRLAEAQGGRIWLDASEPDQGSTFVVAFKKASK